MCSSALYYTLTNDATTVVDFLHGQIVIEKVDEEKRETMSVLVVCSDGTIRNLKQFFCLFFCLKLNFQIAGTNDKTINILLYLKLPA